MSFLKGRKATELSEWKEREKSKVQNISRVMFKTNSDCMRYITKNVEVIYGIDVELVIIYYAWLLTVDEVRRRAGRIFSDQEDWILQAVSENLKQMDSRYFVEAITDDHHILRDTKTTWIEMSYALNSYVYSKRQATEDMGRWIGVTSWSLLEAERSEKNRRLELVWKSLRWLIEAYTEAKRSRRIPL